MKEVFNKIQKILEKGRYNISTFKIMSYNHLETKLFIYYRDCVHIHTWKQLSEDSITHNLTTHSIEESKKYLEIVKKFKQEYEQTV
jgi:hypothetical protein